MIGRLLDRGNKGPLSDDQIWDLNPREKCSNINPVFEEVWTQEQYFRQTRVSINDERKLTQNASHSFEPLSEDTRIEASKQHDNSSRTVPNGVRKRHIGVEHEHDVFPKSPDITDERLKGHSLNNEAIPDKSLNSTASQNTCQALKLSSSSRKKYSLGELTNLVSSDVNGVVWHLTHLTEVLFTPCHIVIVFVQLFRILGLAAAAGLFVVMLLLPLNIYVTMRMRHLFDQLSEKRDEKMTILNEVINGIKVVKLHAWEECFGEKVSAARQKELDAQQRVFTVRAFVVFTWNAAMFVISVVMFGAFIFLSESRLDAKTAFAVVSLLNILRYGVNQTPEVVFDVIKANISIKRLEKFLLQEEFQSNDCISDVSSDCSVVIDNGTFTWDKHGEPSLKNINLQVQLGSLVAVVGQVGCGKSSLLSAILGEMEKSRGRIKVKGQVSYVPQQAWIQSDTIQNNILFGKPMERSRYNKVIDACALGADLKVLPAGDMTKIGERGVNLSGGQKQRVSLARAVYSDADVFLLDDPLAAVDSHVGKHIFNHVISNKGLLKNKTRIWVTHNMRFLQDVDNIVVVADSTISETGAYRQLLLGDGDFRNILKTYTKEMADDDPESSTHNGKRFTRSLCRETSRQQSEHEDWRATSPGQDADDSQILTDRTRWSVYQTYLKAAGLPHAVGIGVTYALYYILWTYANIWLVHWTEDPILKNSANSTYELVWETNVYYFSIYGLLAVLMTLSICVYVFWMASCVVKASTKIHSDLLTSILRSPMSFFETTPTGKITSLFSRDMDVNDTELPFSMEMCLECLLQLGASLVAVCYNTPCLVVVLIPLIYIYVTVQKLEIKTESPIVSYFTEAVTGYDVMRAFGHEGRFQEKNEHNVDQFHRVQFSTLITNRWLGFRLMGIGNGVTGAVSLFTSLGLGSASGALLGLAVSFAYEISETMIWFVIVMSELYTNIISMERVSEFTNNANEDVWKKRDHSVPPGWPQKGRTEFRDYSMRYKPGHDLVLKNLSFTVEAGEKIGVVGRTGAGKSSLMLSLFRMVKPEEGAITIDDVDIADLGLHDVRNNLAIIPQDPVLFTGSLQMNLDPTGRYTDAEIWAALKHTHLIQFVQSLPRKLDAECGEGGQNFSVGQRQLLCLARTLLRKTKVLVLDEATAAVDMETDVLIQETIRSEFKGCTVLTIAHRLNTVMDYDRILVLQNGEIADLDSPIKLLQTNGLFQKLAKDAGLLNCSSINVPCIKHGEAV
ncbi:multidrug resistance-associated protein 1-like [Gigantopelta aegis]|uniref:multidrug resistance-associated protein 1-like n=1 Tax=Gigantopelta aegis TaxID=1735272 RepID=UPI001B887C70|nr:multidrug resistance-associated protein 1-like [Gigantopelta aegis]